MKNSFFCTLLLIILASLANKVSAQFPPMKAIRVERFAADTQYSYTGCGIPSVHPLSYRRAVTYFDTCNAKSYWHNPATNEWTEMGSGGGGGESTITGGIVTSLPVIGIDVGDNISPDSAFKMLYQRSAAPSASISGTPTIYELTSVDSVSISVNYTSTVNLGTVTPITTIITTSQGNTYNKGSSTSTATGTQTVKIHPNSSVTIINTVTANNGQSATASFSTVGQPKWYYGFINSTSPTDAQIIATTGTLVPSLAQIKTQTASGTTVNNSTSSRFVIAVPSNLDASSTLQIWINGLNSTDVFTETTRSLTNASGYSQSYHIYVQNTQTASGVSFQIK